MAASPHQRAHPHYYHPPIDPRAADEEYADEVGTSVSEVLRQCCAESCISALLRIVAAGVLGASCDFGQRLLACGCCSSSSSRLAASGCGGARVFSLSLVVDDGRRLRAGQMCS